MHHPLLLLQQGLHGLIGQAPVLFSQGEEGTLLGAETRPKLTGLWSWS